MVLSYAAAASFHVAPGLAITSSIASSILMLLEAFGYISLCNNRTLGAALLVWLLLAAIDTSLGFSSANLGLWYQLRADTTLGKAVGLVAILVFSSQFGLSDKAMYWFILRNMLVYFEGCGSCLHGRRSSWHFVFQDEAITWLPKDGIQRWLRLKSSRGSTSIKPSSPTPDHLRTFRLSLLDQFVPPSVYVPLVLYYSHDESTANLMQAEISSILKRSLSDALTLYYPFAGRMTGESSADCRDQAVDFFEAQVDTRLSEFLESPQVEVLSQLVPSISEESGGLVLAIQLNYFHCRGIAIGISIGHTLADGCTFGMFVRAWQATARGVTNVVAPIFDVASTLFPPKDLNFGQKPILESSKRQPVTKVFCFSSSKIAALKAEAVASSGSSAVQPSRVEVVTAAIWKLVMARKGNDRCRLSVATHSLDLRRRMDPPLSEYVFGNLIQGAYASGNSEMDLVGLVREMREAIGKIDSEHLKELQGENGYDMLIRNSKKVLEWYSDKDLDYIMFTSVKVPHYQADFGWGKPVWVSSARWDTKNTVFLMDSMTDIGGIEAWITMYEEDMMEFEQQPQLQALVSKLGSAHLYP
ncbi:hypothetical protein Vadar_012456 [Vaccinium darrowii]|uniref:Uncharacterized protein n=1 Tax=Vaccinium darrowii TaxID=229202 RepID=A0ACB7ZJI3_9ERIC|nr:hypothetical protein Vadar_012456 [Vaccinium darrowii]